MGNAVETELYYEFFATFLQVGDLTTGLFDNRHF